MSPLNTTKFIPEGVLMFRRKGVLLGGVPAFPVRKGSSPEAQETARCWVQNTNRNWHSYNATLDLNVPYTEISNLPRGGFRIVGAEQRMEGGRAWKVVTPDGDLVDLREEVFLPILLDRGLPKGGVIDAKFQWCQNGSQLKLIEVGSSLHKEFISEKERDALLGEKKKKASVKKKYISQGKLSIGGVYNFDNFGSSLQRVFLGQATWNGKTWFAWIPHEVLYSKDTRTFGDWGLHSAELSSTCTAVSVSEKTPPKGFLSDLTVYREAIREWCSINGGRIAKWDRNQWVLQVKGDPMETLTWKLGFPSPEGDVTLVLP